MLATLDGTVCHAAQFLHQLVRLFDIDEATGDDVGARYDATVHTRHGQDNHNHAVLGQVLAVTQNDATHIAHTVAVHEDTARGDGAVDFGGVGGELHDLADVADDDVVGAHAHLHGQLCVALEMLLLAVDGDEELGLDQCVDNLEFLLIGVARDVQGCLTLVDDFGIFAEEFVDHTADGVLVARDGRGGEHHTVTSLYVNLAVGGIGHACQSGHGLALAPRGDDANLVLGQATDMRQIDQRILGYLHIAELRGDPHDVFHAAPSDGDLTAIACGHVDNLLDAVYVRGEGGHDNPLFTATEEGIEAGAHAFFGLGEPRAVGVGGVGQHDQHTLVAQLTQASQVNHTALDGGGVNLKVACVQTGANRALDGEAYGVGDGMVGTDELHRELASTHRLPCLAGDELGCI